MHARLVLLFLSLSLIASAAAAARDPSAADLPLTPAAVRSFVRSALEHAGFPERTRALESLGRRAHTSALLPHVHARAGTWSLLSEQVDSTDHSTNAARMNMAIDLRLSWSLDRLLYSGDELPILRLRDEGSILAEKLTSRVTALLSAWQRAFVRRRLAIMQSADALDAELSLFDMQMELDSLTGGDFGRWSSRIQ